MIQVKMFAHDGLRGERVINDWLSKQAPDFKIERALTVDSGWILIFYSVSGATPYRESAS